MPQHRIPTAKGRWSGVGGADRSIPKNANRYDPDSHLRRGGVGSAPFFWRGSISQYNSTRRRFTTLEGDCFFFFFLFGADFHVHRQRLICISSESAHPPIPPSLARSCGFHNTVAAWLKQRSPRQVNNQPTQSAVCDRFHANKAFSNSLLRGSTRRGLSDCSLLITINL